MKKQEQEFELFKFETNIPEVTKNESGQVTGGFIDISTIVCSKGDGVNIFSCNHQCDGNSNENCNCSCEGGNKQCMIPFNPKDCKYHIEHNSECQ